MPKVRIDISMSLDGYVAGPNQSLDDPLGVGGEELHEWVFATAGWREAHGGSGGERNVDDDVAVERESAGATIMGRHMFSSGQGPWEDDPKARGWWGDDPPYHHPVFVLTHHEREPLEMEGGTTFHFVTDGIEAALERARAAAGEKDVIVAGGGQVCTQYLKAGLVDELSLHVAPVFLGSGARLFEDDVSGARGLECDRILESPAGVAHVRYQLR
jgi:dihydrofolate reductase